MGHNVRPLSRSSRPGYWRWNPTAAAASDIDAIEELRAAIDGADAVVNLAGSSVSAGRLGTKHLAEILRSRVDAATALSAAWRQCKQPPSCWLQASAVGFYGDCGDDEVSVDRPPGTNLLAPVCVAWEAAGDMGHEGPRRCICRFGVIIARDSEAWQKTVKPIKFGIGGRLGSGRQFWPWIHADDVAHAILFLAARDDLSGTFNICAPKPVRQADFTKAIAHRLRRPAFVHTPAAALRLAVGPIADNLVLASCRATPAKLLAAGFQFTIPTIEDALDRILDSRH
jgi:uncharacterized protein (TIGR01777 family)